MKELSQNQDILNQIKSIKITFGMHRKRLQIKKQVINDIAIYGHLNPTNGSYGTAKYGDRKSASVTLYDKTY